MLLSGEAGIGKSRLLQAFQTYMAAEARTNIECRASPYHQNSALFPIADYVQQRLQWSRNEPSSEKLSKVERMLEPYGLLLEDVVPLLAALFSLPLPARYAALSLMPQRQKQKTLEVLLTWLLKEAEQQPVYFIMEDLHWADPSTLEFLSLLIEQIPTVRMLMLLTFRPDFHASWAGRSHITHIALSRLTRRQGETMIRSITGEKPLPAEVLQHIVAKSDGVPLFVEEMTRLVLEAGLVKEKDGTYELAEPLLDLEIPATLHDLLMARLDRLGAAKQVVQLGATLG